LLIPVTALRLVWLSMLISTSLCARMMTQKKLLLAEGYARYSNSVCACWFNVQQTAGADFPGITLSYLRSLINLCNCLTATGKVDEEIGLRQQAVEIASRSSYYCDAGKSADSLSWLYRRKKDLVHARHWAERAVGYYEKLLSEACGCGKTHDFTGKHAAVQAWLAEDCWHEKATVAAEQRARKAMDLIGKCTDTDAEVALIRLMDYFFDLQDWAQFQPVAHRYLSMKHAEDDKTHSYLTGQALIRLGSMHTEKGEYSEAEAELLRGLELARRTGKEKILARAESALSELRDRRAGASS
jgi:tetratricopeptide (TPR) repeat protein